MMNRQEVEQQLASPAFYKKAFPGFLAGSTRKFMINLWGMAREKGVADSVLLREDDFGTFAYRVFAFSTKDGVSSENLEWLKKSVDQADLEEIRYEAVDPSGFFMIYDKDGDFFRTDYVLMPLCKEVDDTYLVIISSDHKDQLNCPYIAYTFNTDGSLFFWCIPEKYL